MTEQNRLDRLEALAEKILEGLQETRQRTDSNARSIESLTNTIAELTRDRGQMYQLMADLAQAEVETKREMYRMMGNLDQRQNELSRRQGEIVEILKLLTQLT
ncbi:MAG: hypothetical protein AB4426_01530 [Xenococcaceae cyanobacterium]